MQMFWSFFKIGAFTFGGGYAMVPMIQKEVVESRKWVAGEEFIDMLGLAQTAPGPVAVNTSVFVGYKKAGCAGAVTAVVGATLPSFLVILAIATFFSEIRRFPAVEAAFAGVRPAVVALVAGAAYKIGKTAIRDLRGVAIGALALVAVAVFDVHPIPVIVGSATVGYLVFRRDFKGEAEPQPQADQDSASLSGGEHGLDPGTGPGEACPGRDGSSPAVAGDRNPSSPRGTAPVESAHVGDEKTGDSKRQCKVVDRQ